MNEVAAPRFIFKPHRNFEEDPTMSVAQKTILLIEIVLLVGCSTPAATITENFTRSENAPSITPAPLMTETSLLTNTPIQAQPTQTETIRPTETSTSLPFTVTPMPAPTTTPYGMIPEQIEDGWQTAALADVGIDPVQINQMLAFIYRGDKNGEPLTLPDGDPKFENIHAILIVKDGLLVFEEYFYHYSIENRHNLASVTKSITSLLVGLAIEQGYLEGVGEKVLPYFPEYLPLQQGSEWKERITIENLLTMRHGIACDDWDPDSVTYYKHNFENNQPDTVEATLDLPMETLPGMLYSYCSASTVVLGGVLSKVTGTTIPRFAEQYLFDPLGIGFAAWRSLPGGWTDTCGDLEMRPRDMARLGQLMLQAGNWNGKQIIPADWIDQSIQEHVPLEFNQTWGNGYGYLWWLSDVPIAGTSVHSFAASGAGGQVITIFPDLNMVIVITGGNYQNDEGQPFEIMERFILPAVVAH
jgi:CubicO group peptidase (beta-lactamase class C family)